MLRITDMNISIHCTWCKSNVIDETLLHRISVVFNDNKVENHKVCGKCFSELTATKILSEDEADKFREQQSREELFMQWLNQSNNS